MEETPPDTNQIKIEAGSLVILHPDAPAGGFPMVVAVDQVIGNRLWFLGCVEPLRRGETLSIESPIPKDARYITRGRIAASSPETFALELDQDWERVQQRAFVRISAHGQQVRVVRVNPDPEFHSQESLAGEDGEDEAATGPDTDSVYALLDISAGGVRFAAGDEYEADEEVICHFELPGALCFVLPARIVRGPDTGEGARTKNYVAAEFVGLDEQHRSQLLRWVYREQVRRHREDARAEEAARQRAERAERERRSRR